MSKKFVKHQNAKDLREGGRIILAHGEVTGHVHEITCSLGECGIGNLIPSAEYFEEPDGRRVLLVLSPCVLKHEEHGHIALDPEYPIQVRQGDVMLKPLGAGAWEVIRQREYSPEAVRAVED